MTPSKTIGIHIAIKSIRFISKNGTNIIDIAYPIIIPVQRAHTGN